MSGTETVHYMHLMNWVYQLPGTFIGDYGDSGIKGRGCQLDNTGTSHSCKFEVPTKWYK